MRNVRRAGVRAAVIYDSGFSEAGGEGKAMQERIVAMCREAGIALCGPNCMGILNPSARSTSFKQTIRTAQGLAGNVALVSQSGSIAGTLLADLRRFGSARWFHRAMRRSSISRNISNILQPIPPRR